MASPSTIIRVKRRLDDSPAEAVVLIVKKRKTEECFPEEEQPRVTNILSFSGTIKEKDTIPAQVPTNFKTHIPNIRHRKRSELKTQQSESRFRLLNLARSADKGQTILDVTEEEEELEGEYVYDLYTTNLVGCEDINDAYLENMLSIHTLSPEMEYRNSEDVDDIDDPCDEDSNDENYWKNEYPDSDHSVNEDVLCLSSKFNRCGLDGKDGEDGDDLSSDDDDEHYLEEAGYYRSYRKYKNEVSEHLKDSLVECYSDEGENDYYDY